MMSLNMINMLFVGSFSACFILVSVYVGVCVCVWCVYDVSCICVMYVECKSECVCVYV